MIGKKRKSKKDDKDSSQSSSISESDEEQYDKNKKIKNKDDLNDDKIKKNNKSGLSIKELKEHIKNNKNLNDNDENNKEKNKPKYTKIDSSDSDSDSSDKEKNKEKFKNENDEKDDDEESEEVKNKKKKEEEKINNKKSHPEFTKSAKVNYTLSILIPSSIVDNAQSKELRTYLIGELARTIGIFKISEVIIFHDKKDNSRDYINYFIKNLQYLETPQYLRKTLFPMSEDLKLSGLMNPLESQHHLRKDEWSTYREGCVLDRPVSGEYSWVNIGLNKDCKIDQKLPPKTRVTVKLNEKGFNNKLKYYTGTPVSMSEPFIKNGTYWGYVVRVCETYKDIFNESIYDEGYDFVIGTSDKGENYRTANFMKKKDFKHCLIIFGGISGIEGMMIDDEHNKINSKNISKNFDLYLNTCMNQGLRTIRTEEAILISLAVIRPELDKIKEVDY